MYTCIYTYTRMNIHTFTHVQVTLGMAWTPRIEVAEDAQIPDDEWYEEAREASPDIDETRVIPAQRPFRLDHEISSLYNGFVSMLCGDMCANREQRRIALDWNGEGDWEEDSEGDARSGV